MKNAPPLSSLGEEIFEIFQFISTQLRTSFSGIIGLDYNVLFKLFDILGIDRDDQLLYLKGINVIEREMLNSIQEKEKRKKKEAQIDSEEQLQSKSIIGRR